MLCETHEHARAANADERPLVMTRWRLDVHRTRKLQALQIYSTRTRTYTPITIVRAPASKAVDTADLLVAPSCRLARAVNARRLGSPRRCAPGEGRAARRVAAAQIASDVDMHGAEFSTPMMPVD